jgi:hypothetical protein
MVDVQTSEVRMLSFDQSTRDYEIFYADRSQEDKQVMRPLLRGQKYEHGGVLNAKIDILFYGDNRCTYDTVWCNERSWTCLQVLFEQLFFLTDLLNMTMVGFSY